MTRIPHYQDPLASTRQALSGNDIINMLLIGLSVMAGHLYLGNFYGLLKGLFGVVTIYMVVTNVPKLTLEREL